MKIIELEEGAFEGTIEGKITELEEPREITTKFGRRLKVANGKIEDDSGSIKLALWNEDAEKYKEGDRIKITNGYVSRFKDELNVSAGRNGKIEKV